MISIDNHHLAPIISEQSLETRVFCLTCHPQAMRSGQPESRHLWSCNVVKREKFPERVSLEISEEDDVLLTKREVAAMIGCCTRTVMRMCARGQLPPPIVFNSQFYRWSRQAIRDHLRKLRGAVEEAA